MSSSRRGWRVGKSGVTATIATESGTRARLAACRPAGIERSVHHGSMGEAGAYSVGYRLGVINGYDSRLIRGAGSTPVVPFAQVIGNASWKRIGIQGSYCWLVFTGGFFVRL